MASKSPSDCCTRGFKHEGQSSGQIVDIEGIETYIAGNPANASRRFHILFTDVFGPHFINLQLLADQFAAEGWFVVIPDLFEKDPVPLNPPQGFEFAEWKAKHTPENVDKIVDKFTKAVFLQYKPQHTVATGYCFGAKPAVRLLGTGTIQAAAIFHPSYVSIKEVEAIKGPILICAAENDPVFGYEERHMTEKALLECKVAYRITLSSGTSHGFAARCDLSEPWTRYAKERAFYDAVDWFKITQELAN